MNQVIFGDCRDSMRQLIADGVKVQMACTSPPYWGLRDYGTATWDGGDPDCDHLRVSGGQRGGRLEGGDQRGRSEHPYIYSCGKCGAVRDDKQLGLEPTPAEYVANMVEVFGLVRDLLTDDGVLWLNLGDSYARMQEGNVPQSKNAECKPPVMRGRAPNAGLKPKDLVGIPWRVAFALQADGWYLRCDVIWSKPNPMPESVTDRPTKAHEYLFLLSKNERYYYDADAIKEPAIYSGITGMDESGFKNAANFNGKHSGGVVERGERQDKQRGHSRRHAGFNDRWDAMEKSEQCSGKRNKRSVWTVATTPYSGAHFATFPPALIEPCILAGSRPGDVVLDPFFGSGTTGQVAQQLGRKWVGCELNQDYEPLQQARTAQQGLELVA